MKKYLIFFVIVIAALFCFKTEVPCAKAVGETDEPSVEAEDLLERLDVSALQEYFNTLSEEQKNVLGGTLTEFLKNTVNGEFGSYESFLTYLFSCVGTASVHVLPLLISVVAVAILTSLVNGVKGNFSSKSVDDIVNFAGISSVSIIVLLQFFSLIKAVGECIINMKTQMEAVFPLLFTLMSALGASGSIAVYQPSVAVISFGITQLITVIVLPMLIVTVAFSIVGNLSSSVKLSGLNKFFSSVSKWLLGTAFFLFVGFLSIKGITAAVYDNMSVRTAKFALSKYIPVIGGYLSEGFNLVLAGTVLVKNAIGGAAVTIMFVSVLPILIQTIIFSLTLKLAAGLTEPFSCERLGSLLNGVSTTASLLIAITIGAAFSYFVFLLLLICSGNLVL